MIDTWRRKKPEFWHTKKAYSPFKVLQTEFDGYKQGEYLSVPVYNRYNHTNFHELTIKYTYQNREGILDLVDIKPHTKGTLSIPIKNLKPNEFILLEAFDRNNELVDKYKLRLKTKNQIKGPDDNSGEISLIEDEGQLTIICKNNTRIIFDKISGLIKEVQKPSGNFSFSGPHLNLRVKGKPIDHMRNHINEYVEDWTLNYFSYKREENRVIVSVKGNSSNLSMIDFEITIESAGQISTKYEVKEIPSEFIREIGIRFDSDNNIDSLSWKRDTYWSYYPPNHLSAPVGNISIYSNTPNVYRKAPEKEWIYDTKSFYYNGTDSERINEQLTFIAKATKENIREYNLYETKQKVISVMGNGDISCRIAKNENGIMLYVNNIIDYFNLGWGNFQRNKVLDNNYSNEVVIQINTHSNIIGFKAQLSPKKRQ
jgi:hypothetical protein